MDRLCLPFLPPPLLIHLLPVLLHLSGVSQRRSEVRRRADVTNHNHCRFSSNSLQSVTVEPEAASQGRLVCEGSHSTRSSHGRRLSEGSWTGSSLLKGVGESQVLTTRGRGWVWVHAISRIKTFLCKHLLIIAPPPPPPVSLSPTPTSSRQPQPHPHLLVVPGEALCMGSLEPVLLPSLQLLQD